MKYSTLDSIIKKNWPEIDVLGEIPFGETFKKLGGYIEISDESLRLLKQHGVPPGVLQKLQSSGMKDKTFTTCRDFEDALHCTLSEKGFLEYEKQILNILIGSHGRHVRAVLESMNKLLSQAPVTALVDINVPENQKYVAVFLSVCHEIRGDDGIFSRSSMGQHGAESFLRLAALYHDIGKIIHRDRHPLEGYHYIAHVDQRNAEELRKDEMLGDEGFSMLCQLIRHHDLYGVIGTGEGSAPVLIDTLPFQSSTVIEQQTLLSLLFLLNIADIAGVIPLTSQKASTLATEWKRLCTLLKECEGDRLEFTKRLIASEQNPARAIERIRRLLLAPVEPNCLQPEQVSAREVAEALRVTLGIQFHEFWSDFALVCKLDYALRFITQLEQYASENNIRAYTVIEVVVSLIKALVQSYSALTKRPDGTRRRIGIEVSGLTRTAEISKSLIRLLFDDLPRGLGWASEEATAWYFE